MPEINPYESPQSNGFDLRQPPVNEDNAPTWIGRALTAQLLLVLFTLFSPFGWFIPLLQFAILLLHGIIAMAMLFVAIRYRIGYLVVLELIVLGLPLMMLFTVEFQ